MEWEREEMVATFVDWIKIHLMLCFASCKPNKIDKIFIRNEIYIAARRFDSVPRHIEKESGAIQSDRKRETRKPKRSEPFIVALLFFAYVAITFQQQQIVWHIFHSASLSVVFSWLFFFLCCTLGPENIKSSAFKIPFWCCDKRVTCNNYQISSGFFVVPSPSKLPI